MWYFIRETRANLCVCAFNVHKRYGAITFGKHGVMEFLCGIDRHRKQGGQPHTPSAAGAQPRCPGDGVRQSDTPLAVKANTARVCVWGQESVQGRLEDGNDKAASEREQCEVAIFVN